MEFLLFIVILTIVVGAFWVVADLTDELGARRQARGRWASSGRPDLPGHRSPRPQARPRPGSSPTHGRRVRS